MYIFYKILLDYIPETLDLNILCGIIPTCGKGFMYPRIYFIGIYLKRFVSDIDLTTFYSRCVYLFLTVDIIFTCNIVCTLALTHQVNKSRKMLTFSNL